MSIEVGKQRLMYHPINSISHGVTLMLITMLWVTLAYLSLITDTNAFSTMRISPGLRSREATRYRPLKSEAHSSMPLPHTTVEGDLSWDPKKAKHYAQFLFLWSTPPDILKRVVRGAIETLIYKLAGCNVLYLIIAGSSTPKFWCKTGPCL